MCRMWSTVFHASHICTSYQPGVLSKLENKLLPLPNNGTRSSQLPANVADKFGPSMSRTLRPPYFYFRLPLAEHGPRRAHRLPSLGMFLSDEVMPDHICTLPN